MAAEKPHVVYRSQRTYYERLHSAVCIVGASFAHIFLKIKIAQSLRLINIDTYRIEQRWNLLDQRLLDEVEFGKNKK